MWHSYGAPIPGRTSGTILGWWCGRSYRCPYSPSAPHHPALHLPGNDWPQLPKHPLAKTKTVIKFIFSFKKKTNNSFFLKAWLLLHDREKWHKIRTPKSLGNFWGFFFFILRSLTLESLNDSVVVLAQRMTYFRHTWNQSMVQQLTRDGNLRSLLRKASPIGLMANTIWSWSRTLWIKKLNKDTGVPSVCLVLSLCLK